MKQIKNKKHAIILAIGLAIMVGLVLAIALLCFNGEKTFSESSRNTFSLETIDDYSPDRIIVFYVNGHKIEESIIERVETEDGIILCQNGLFVVNMFELEDIDTIIVVTKDNKTFKVNKQ